MSIGERRRGANDSVPIDMRSRDLFRRPSAFVPLGLSLAAFMLVAGHVAIYGAAREADEGTAAHLWQLLMATQVPVIGFFLIKWLPGAPRPAMIILALQVAAAVAAVAPVYFLHL